MSATRKYVRWMCLASALAGLALAETVRGGPSGANGASKPPALRTGVVPLGSLGHALGDYLTIEGVRLDAGKAGASTLRVDTVNGRKLPERIDIWIENLKLPKEKRCKL